MASPDGEHLCFPIRTIFHYVRAGRCGVKPAFHGARAQVKARFHYAQAGALGGGDARSGGTLGAGGRTVRGDAYATEVVHELGAFFLV
jgi:hypothetical protein